MIHHRLYPTNWLCVYVFVYVVQEHPAHWFKVYSVCIMNLTNVKQDENDKDNNQQRREFYRVYTHCAKLQQKSAKNTCQREWTNVTNCKYNWHKEALWIWIIVMLWTHLNRLSEKVLPKLWNNTTTRGEICSGFGCAEKAKRFQTYLESVRLKLIS